MNGFQESAGCDEPARVMPQCVRPDDDNDGGQRDCSGPAEEDDDGRAF